MIFIAAIVLMSAFKTRFAEGTEIVLGKRYLVTSRSRRNRIAETQSAAAPLSFVKNIHNDGSGILVINDIVCEQLYRKHYDGYKAALYDERQ